MEKQKLIVRRTDGKDRRISRVWLTAKGKALEKTVLPAVAEYVEEVFASLSVEERQQLASLTDRLIGVMMRGGERRRGVLLAGKGCARGLLGCVDSSLCDAGRRNASAPKRVEGYLKTLISAAEVQGLPAISLSPRRRM